MNDLRPTLTSQLMLTILDLADQVGRTQSLMLSPFVEDATRHGITKDHQSLLEDLQSWRTVLKKWDGHGTKSV